MTLREPQGEQLSEIDIRILGGNPTPEEVAATTAVVSAVLEELVAEQGRVTQPGPTTWAHTQRPFRSPITPGYGSWRGFSG